MPEELQQAEFFLSFWNDYDAYPLHGMINVDETAIKFDIPPTKIWAVRGRKGSTKISQYTKHCGRLTAALSIRADGKLLLIFVCTISVTNLI